MFLGAGTLERQGNVSVTCTSYVGPPVWCSDLPSGRSRDQEIRRLRMFQLWYLRNILGLTLWDWQRNVVILKQVGEVPVEEQLKQRQLQ